MNYPGMFVEIVEVFAEAARLGHNRPDLPEPFPGIAVAARSRFVWRPRPLPSLYACPRCGEAFAVAHSLHAHKLHCRHARTLL